MIHYLARKINSMFKARINLEKTNVTRLQFTNCEGEPRVYKGRTLFCNYARNWKGTEGYGITEMHSGLSIVGGCPSPEIAWSTALGVLDRMTKATIEREIRKTMNRVSPTTRIINLLIEGVI